MLTVGSLFAGIGGFDLGLERAGMRSVWQCEIDPYAQRVLEKHWPDVLRVPDIRDVNADTVPAVDLICGGFPCQGISFAGLGLGLADERSGLWSEMLRVIRDLRPRWVVVENVAALLSRGLDVVLGGLAAVGYDAEWDCVPASAVGAPHRRDRIWLVAYPHGQGEHDGAVDAEMGSASEPLAHAGRERGPTRGRASDLVGTSRADQGEGDQRERHGDAAHDRGADLADADGARLEGHGGSVLGTGERPAGSPRAGLGDVARYAAHWVSEPDVGRVAHGVPARMDRLRGLGNSLVPQIAELIGRRIIDYEEGRVAA